MNRRAVQDDYPDDMSHCYGCGRLNPGGLQIKSRREEDEMVARFRPEPGHTSMPGFVYGGLLASLVDCHAMAVATDAASRARPEEGIERFVTASLEVHYLRPTPIGVELEIRGKIEELKGRKAVVSVRILAGGVECVRGRVVGVRLPETMYRPANRPVSNPG
ncbi:MAG: PaaI family thioesterase [Acidobacteriota bacterium]|jgi:acyl-coenzyme A thioesterase PaaI-like protein|nr:PaaI family thioesterase [Acidobacteriota bacterium]NLT32651.1 PaaI family thioesterase [Acidobacteriota bacterium]